MRHCDFLTGLPPYSKVGKHLRGSLPRKVCQQEADKQRCYRVAERRAGAVNGECIQPNLFRAVNLRPFAMFIC